MFRGCSGLTGSIPSGMTFENNAALRESQFMFYNCSGLTGQVPPMALGSPPSLPDARSMFRGCPGLTDIASGFTLPSAGTSYIFDVTISDVPVEAGQAAGTVDLAGRLVTTYAGSDPGMLSLDWAAQGRSMGSSKYVVELDANGGSGAIAPARAGAAFNASPNAKNGALYAIPACSLARTGYSHDGWARSATGDAAYALEGSFSNLARSGTATLFAHWSAISYEIALDPQGGSVSPSRIAASYDADVELPVPARPGHACMGWDTEPGGTGERHQAGAVARNLAEDDGATVALYAQ